MQCHAEYFNFEKHGFEVNVTFEDDPYPVSDFLGEFSRDWKKDAFYLTRDREGREPGINYYIPFNSLESHRTSLHKMGYSKHESYTMARNYVLRDLEHAVAMGYRWGYITITAVVTYEGRDIGEDSLSMVESNGDEYYLYSLTSDVVLTALTRARDFLAKVKSPKTTDAERIVVAYDRLMKQNNKRYESKYPRFRKWRDLSHDYQNNRKVTRHAQKHLDLTRTLERIDYMRGHRDNSKSR